MNEIDSLNDLIIRLDAGDEDAANELFCRYSSRLIGFARTRLDGKIKQKVDPEDVVQSVFRSFFVRHAKGEFDFANWGSMWGLLVTMTLRKCGRKAENLLAACRDVRREVTQKHATESGNDSWELVVRDPTPQEIAVLNETVEMLMRGLKDVERQILELKLQNYRNVEIAEKIGNISERKVYRVLDKVKERLTELIA